MALVTTRPTVGAMRNDVVDRFIDRFLGREFETQEPTMLTSVWAPSLDFSETDDEYIVKLDAPGVPKENLDVTLDANVLTISGRRELAKDGEPDGFIWREREEGRFVRTLRLPTPVMEDKIKASADAGVLTVRLPKVKQAATSKILIR